MRKRVLQFTATGLTIIVLFIILLLKPVVLYAHKKTVDNYIIYYNNYIPTNFETLLLKADNILKKSELNDSNFKINICLNDQNIYLGIVRKCFGEAFAWGFYHNVVIGGKFSTSAHAVEINGYKWNTEELLAHEMIHCLEYNKLGLLKSNPIANYPLWKWEGYPEYISRQSEDQKYLFNNISRLIEIAKSNKKEDFIFFADSTISTHFYFQSWLLVKYCMDVKKQSFTTLLKDSISLYNVKNQMVEWYNKLKFSNTKGY